MGPHVLRLLSWEEQPVVDSLLVLCTYIFFSEIGMDMNEGEINVSNAMRQIEIGGWRGLCIVG
jgi:hypothetical protein